MPDMSSIGGTTINSTTETTSAVESAVIQTPRPLAPVATAELPPRTLAASQRDNLNAGLPIVK